MTARTVQKLPSASRVAHDYLRMYGPTTPEVLASHLRGKSRSWKMDEKKLTELIRHEPLLVPMPDGTLTHLIHLLHGAVFTRRMRGPTAGRNDVWAGTPLLPVHRLVRERPLRLSSGGLVRISDYYEQVLVGPPGWLPSVDQHELLGFRLDAGQLTVVPINELDVVGPDDEQVARDLLVRHYRELDPLPAWHPDAGDLNPVDVMRAVTNAIVELPELFRMALPPLDQLLHGCVDQGSPTSWYAELQPNPRAHPTHVVIRGMPAALRRQLEVRAQKYGMSFDDYVIAVLGHLAWRTPFANDIGDWNAWIDDRPEPRHHYDEPPSSLDDQTRGGSAADRFAAPGPAGSARPTGSARPSGATGPMDDRPDDDGPDDKPAPCIAFPSSPERPRVARPRVAEPDELPF